MATESSKPETGPSKPEIDNHIMKLIVGVIALTLASLTALFSPSPLGLIPAPPTMPTAGRATSSSASFSRSAHS